MYISLDITYLLCSPHLPAGLIQHACRATCIHTTYEIILLACVKHLDNLGFDISFDQPEHAPWCRLRAVVFKSIVNQDSVVGSPFHPWSFCPGSTPVQFERHVTIRDRARAKDERLGRLGSCFTCLRRSIWPLGKVLSVQSQLTDGH